MVMRRILIALCVLGGVARADGPTENYDDWKNRPRERFSEAERNFREAKSQLLKEYADDKLTEEDLYRSAVRGMLAGAGGRKWDTLLAPGELAEMQGDMQGEVVGIGVEIKFNDGAPTTVLGTIAGSPAEAAGLKSGDAILKIDGKSMKGAQFRDIVYAIRGKSGSSVKLTLLRDDAIIDKTIVRRSIPWSPVSEATLPDRVALIHVAAFTEKTPAQLRAALERAKTARGLILDLRGNEGGLLDKMLACAGLLLPKGSLVVTSVGRGGKEDPHRTTDEPVLKNTPLIVLINSNTTSGAEILAGALKAASARLVGQKTHGKWNAQRISTLPNKWAMKYTVAVFKTPTGDLLDGIGLDPDIAVDLDPPLAEKAQHLKDPKARLTADPQLRSAVALLPKT
jgi:carboxyl-terminal processing protease